MGYNERYSNQKTQLFKKTSGPFSSSSAQTKRKTYCVPASDKGKTLN